MSPLKTESIPTGLWNRLSEREEFDLITGYIKTKYKDLWMWTSVIELRGYIASGKRTDEGTAMFLKEKTVVNYDKTYECFFESKRPWPYH